MANYQHPGGPDRDFRRPPDDRPDYDQRGYYHAPDRHEPRGYAREDHRHPGPYPSQRYADEYRPQNNPYYSDLGSDQDRRGGYSAGFSGPPPTDYRGYGSAAEERFSTDNGPLPRAQGGSPGYGTAYSDYDGFNSRHRAPQRHPNDNYADYGRRTGSAPRNPNDYDRGTESGRRGFDAESRPRTYRTEAPTGYGSVYGSYDASLYGPLTDYDPDDFGYGGHGTGRRDHRDEDDWRGNRRGR